MCLIVFKENEESVFTNRKFKNMIRRNRDGLGIMWRENGRVLTERYVGNERGKFELFQKHREKEMWAMHARLTTHGQTNIANCHPYEILNMDKGDPIDLYMMHNGVLSQAPEVDKTMSDTWHFVEYILKPIAKSNLDLLWNSDEFQTWLQKTISGSKLLFMRSDDDADSPVLILNAQAGIEENGCWLSNGYSTNTSHVSYNKPAKTTTYNYNGGSISKENPTLATNGTNSACTTKDNLPWADDWAARRKESENTLQNNERTSKLFLPNSSESSKIIELKPKETKLLPYYDDPNIHLAEIVSQLNGLSTYAVKEWVKDDPDQTADIILAFYEKNTMPYELIIQQIADKDGIDGIVDIIRHIASYKTVPITTKVS